MGIRKQIQFDQGDRSYRIVTDLDNTYDIDGFNRLMQKVPIHAD